MAIKYGGRVDASVLAYQNCLQLVVQERSSDSSLQIVSLKIIVSNQMFMEASLTARLASVSTV